MNAMISSIISVTRRVVVDLVEPEAADVLEVPLGRLRRPRSARARRRLVDLVVHVGDVVDERDVVAAQPQPARVPGADHVRAGVPDVRTRVHRRAADVHADRPRRLGQVDERRAGGCYRAASTLRSASSSGSAAITVHSSGAALGARERQPERLQVAADRLQLPDDLAPVEPGRAELDEAPQRRLGLLRKRDRLRLEDRLRHRPRLDEVARAAQRAGELRRRAGALGERLVGERLDRVDRQPADALLVEVHVVHGLAELLEVGAHRLGRDAGVRSDAIVGAPVRLESFLPSSPSRRPWWTYSGGSKPSARDSSRCSSVFER